MPPALGKRGLIVLVLIGAGVWTGCAVAGTLLRANVAISYDDDGIDVRSASTRLRENTANGNGDFGIKAIEGVTDLGGNVAGGNGFRTGNPLQCQNVFCG
jgi:hypothetical protein